MTELRNDANFTDLGDDIVYNYLKEFALDGYKVLGGKITEPRPIPPKGAAKVIQLAVLNLKTNQRTYPKYNYKRYERELKQKLRREHGNRN